ncbi:MAG TPA: ABC transporter ATP-binding protein [Candidatus Limnocylindrales bacterium]|jgi:ABC-2 type transport system ATP-binding protein
MTVQPTEPAVRVGGLVRTFDGRRAVDGLSFEVAAGETFGLLGHNGAGKTTTIRLLNGVLARHGGDVSVLGLDPGAEGERVRARTGVLTETPSLDERLSATENLEFYGRLYGVVGSRLRERVATVLAAFGLADRAGERVARYSRGMKQRLALARTLVHDPDILFLDEPTAALDPVAAREVHELVEGFHRDRRRTVVLCTHNLVEAERLCDRVAIMRDGRAIAIGGPAELARSIGVPLTVEVEVDEQDRERALAALRDVGVSELGPTRAGITFHVARRDAIPQTVAALVRAGVPVFRVANAEPDLETVYFALYGRTDEGAEPSP